METRHDAVTNDFDSSDDEVNEVDLSPFNIDWLDLSASGLVESLGVSALPGCRFKDTWRSLKHDIESLIGSGVREMFILCTRGELNKYRVPRLLGDLKAAGLAVHHYPFLDGNVPAMASLSKMLDQIRVNLMNGVRSVVHCFGGLGRSCLVAVCLLMVLDPDISPECAIERLRKLRGPGAIQTVKQYNFINDFRSNMVAFEQEICKEERTVSR